MDELELFTPRLHLFPCSSALSPFVYSPKHAMESQLGGTFADDWLNGEGRDLIAYYVHWTELDPSLYGWGLWFIQHRTSAVIFGSIGFKGKPNDDGMIEMGYGVSEDYRLQGFTFEAAQHMVAWAFGQPTVRQITAECLHDNQGSVRILEKLGMMRIGQDGEYIKWKLDPPV
jgi:[ribosomal protein S5]-alanine N-acetyltransferase